jgi:hypothetical protein
MHRRSPLIVTGVLLVVALSVPAVAFGAAAQDPAAEPLVPDSIRPPLSSLQPPPVDSGGSQGQGQGGQTGASGGAKATPGKLPEQSAPSPAPRSIAPSGSTPYAMDFTLPTLGKSGCMVCHGDRNLIRIQGDQYVSFYIPPGLLEASVHGPGSKTGAAGVLCTGCHLDFASKAPHMNDAEWQRTAKSACAACHQPESTDFSNGVHSVSNRPGQADPKADQKPLCGDCHGGHDIERLDTAGRALLHDKGWQVCGRCHVDKWNDYADYYHGAAYVKGAADAPACWECHGSHQILPSSDRRSPTNPDNLIDTCSGKTAGKQCHQGVNDDFVSYAGLIHARASAYQANPVYQWIHGSQTGISELLSNIADTVRSWFG